MGSSHNDGTNLNTIAEYWPLHRVEMDRDIGECHFNILLCQGLVSNGELYSLSLPFFLSFDHSSQYYHL